VGKSLWGIDKEEEAAQALKATIDEIFIFDD